MSVSAVSKRRIVNLQAEGVTSPGISRGTFRRVLLGAYQRLTAARGCAILWIRGEIESPSLDSPLVQDGDRAPRDTVRILVDITVRLAIRRSADHGRSDTAARRGADFAEAIPQAFELRVA